MIRFGEFEFDMDRRRLTRKHEPVRLAGQALELLTLLAQRPGEVVTRDEIKQVLWPSSNQDLEHSLDVLVNRLRRTLGDDGANRKFIETMPRKGFRLLAPVANQSSGADGNSMAHQHRYPEQRRPTLRLVRTVLRSAVPYVLVALMAVIAAILFARTRYDRFVPPQRPRVSVHPVTNGR